MYYFYCTDFLINLGQWITHKQKSELPPINTTEVVISIGGSSTMIDPITAMSAATAAFSTVKRLVNAGQDFENCMGSMSKWYTNVSDFRKGQQLNKNPPLFKKLFNAGSVEEEALNLIIQEKKLIEMEKELQNLLNFRFGFGTWDELKEMQRKIRREREATIYKQEERKRALFEALAIGAMLLLLGGIVVFVFYLIGIDRGVL